MLSRISFLAVLAVALVALSGPSVRAAEEKAGDGKITLTFKGVEGKHTHDVAKDAKITLDDKKAKLEELKEGFLVKVTMDDKFVVTKIDAQAKKK